MSEASEKLRLLGGMSHTDLVRRCFEIEGKLYDALRTIDKAAVHAANLMSRLDTLDGRLKLEQAAAGNLRHQLHQQGCRLSSVAKWLEDYQYDIGARCAEGLQKILVESQKPDCGRPYCTDHSE